jgi:ApaG protein
MEDCAHSDATTAGIQVQVRSRYLPDQLPELPRHAHERLFGYHIAISNHTAGPVQLLRRHWLIIDAEGVAEEVEGDGVVGEQPLIEAGQRYAYGSFCPLRTDWGTMEGFFTMADAAGREFAAAIQRFHLYVPRDQPALVSTGQ